MKKFSIICVLLIANTFYAQTIKVKIHSINGYGEYEAFAKAAAQARKAPRRR